MTRNQEIAQTIIQQLGGMNRLRAMTGAKDFVAIENGVHFRIGRNAKSVNAIRIVLTPEDLYDFEALNVSTRGIKVRSESKGIFCDMLMDTFEAATGMYLTLAARA